MGVLGRRHRPSGDLRLIGHEETIQMPGLELRRGGLLTDDVDDVLAVEPPGVTPKGLFTVVVILLLVFKILVESAVVIPGRDSGDGPPGKGP